MCLACDKPRVILELYHFNNMLVGGESAYVHTVFLKQVSVIVVYLVTVTVTLGNELLTVCFVCF